MNKTINVNIGGYPFIIDEDAHLMLSSYLQQIEGRLSPLERKEIMEDVENRIADIFSQRIGVRTQVISSGIVREAMSIIGNAEDFGDAQYQSQGSSTNTPPSPKNDTSTKNKSTGLGFLRSRTDKMLGGICGGLAPVIGIDVTVLRLILALMIILSFSAVFWAYIILWVIIPQEPVNGLNNKENERR